MKENQVVEKIATTEHSAKKPIPYYLKVNGDLEILNSSKVE